MGGPVRQVGNSDERCYISLTCGSRKSIEAENAMALRLANDGYVAEKDRGW
jgi:hypothetical protein